MISVRMGQFRSAIRVSWIAALSFGWNSIATASEGALSITVLDAPTTRPLQGASIQVTSRTGDVRTVTTGGNGTALLAGLPDGLYEVRAEAEGRVPAVEPTLRVIPRRTTAVRFELRLRSETIEEVIVTARAREADPYGAVGNGFFNREELRNAVGAGSDVMRALDGLPGLISTGDFANFSVRGRGPRNNLILIDGFPFEKVVHFDQTLGEEEDIGGGGRFSIFAPNSVTGAEFSPGGWSAAFGGRSGSLLQLEVAAGAPTPSATLRVDIAGVEFGYEGPSGLRDDTTLFLTARQFDFGRVFELIGEDDIGEPELTDVILKTRTQLNASNELEFLVINAPEDYVRNIGNVLASPNFEDVALLTAEQDLSLVGVTWRRLIGDNADWTNRIYLRDSDKTSTEGEAFPDLVPPGTPENLIPAEERLLTVTEKETEIGWRSDVTLQNTFGQFEGGLRVVRVEADFSTFLRQDWTRYIFRQSDPRPPGQAFIVLSPTDINSRFDTSETSYAIYGEQTFEWGAWDFRAGLRFDDDGFADESLLSPRLSVNYQYSPRLRLSATAGIFYESPRYLIRGANPDNFDLRNEQITHFSLGFEQRFTDRWALLVEGYFQRLDDLIVEPARTSARVTNEGDGRNVGADVVLARAFGNGWSANASYSYNRTRLDDNDGLGEYPADFSRTNFLGIGGRWEINERWQIAARWKYGTGRPTDSFVINSDVLGPGQPLRFSKALTARNAERLDDYHSLNLRIDYRRPLGPVDLVAFVDVINVYGGPSNSSREFDPRRGIIVDDDGEALPLIGLIFERSW